MVMENTDRIAERERLINLPSKRNSVLDKLQVAKKTANETAEKWRKRSVELDSTILKVLRGDITPESAIEIIGREGRDAGR